MVFRRRRRLGAAIAVASLESPTSDPTKALQEELQEHRAGEGPHPGGIQAAAQAVMVVHGAQEDQAATADLQAAAVGRPSGLAAVGPFSRTGRWMGRPTRRTSTGPGS